MEEERSRLQLDWVKIVGGALAATSSALLLSTLGVTGTIIGAAAGSVVVTVGGSVYTHYLDLSRQRVANAQLPVRRRADDGRIQPTVARRERQPRISWREALAGLPWRNIALGAMGMFLLVMVAITVFELAMGRAVSTYTGGSDRDTRTSITGRGGGADSEGDDTEPSQNTSPDGDTEPTTTSTPTTEGPSPTPTTSPTAEEASPSTLRRSTASTPTSSPTPTSTTSEPPTGGLSPR